MKVYTVLTYDGCDYEEKLAKDLTDFQGEIEKVIVYTTGNTEKIYHSDITISFILSKEVK